MKINDKEISKELIAKALQCDSPEELTGSMSIVKPGRNSWIYEYAEAWEEFLGLVVNMRPCKLP